MEDDNKNLISLEYNKIVNLLEKYCKTYIGRKKLFNMKPSFSFEEVQKLLNLTTEAINMRIAFGNIPLSEIAEIEPYFKIIKSEINLSCKALLEIAQVLKLSSELKKYFNSNISNNSNSFILLEDIFSSLYVNDYIVMEITNKIIDENTIADNASPTLLNLRKKRRILEQRLKDKLQDLVHSKSKFMMDSIITIRDGRYVVPVKEEYRNEIKGLVHDISSSGSTLYIEPITTFEMNNEIQNIKVDEEKEIIKILKELTLALAPLQDAIFSNIDTIGNLDLIFAKASYSSETNGNEPILNKDKYLNFVKVRHPLINKNVVVPIDIEIGKDFSCLVITGPNTGGKTATLKTVGLNLLLSYSGIYPLCNIGTNICVFDKIFIDIGDEQSIQASLSTFSSHMTNIINITNSADSNSLILLDELGSGTDPIEGASLAISTLKYLYNAGSIILSTTHYPELKNYALVTKGFKNASCDFDVASLRPTYKLLIGIPGKSNAFAISRKLGLSEEIIQRATSMIDKETINLEDLLKKIYDDKAKIETEKAQTVKALEEAQKLRDSLKNQHSNVSEREKELISNAKQEAKQILLDAKETANSLIRDISSTNSASQANKLRNKLNDKIASVSATSENAVIDSISPAILRENIKPGLNVYVSNLKTNGTVVSNISKDDTVQVQIGMMKMKVDIKNLHETSSASTSGKNKSGKNSGAQISNGSNYSQKSSFKAQSVSPEINLLGMTVDEAIPIVDKYLDDCYIAKLSPVRIVHGKGTGALRNGIQKYLKTNKIVDNFRPGTFR